MIEWKVFGGFIMFVLFSRIRKGAPGYLIVINLGESMEMVNYANEDSIPSDASVVVRSTIAKDPLQVKGCVLTKLVCFE